MAKILVTGATGFIGGHLAKALTEQGHRVRCLVRPNARTASLRALGAELVQGDLVDMASVERAVAQTEVVFHLAGLTTALRPRQMIEINGGGTRYIATACARQTTPPVLIYVSSVAAAGPTERHRVRTEQDRPNPISNYGRSKRLGEIEVERLADRVPTTIVRPGIVFGPSGREMLPMFWSVYRLRFHLIAGLRSPPLSVIYVSELVDLLIRAAREGQRLPSSSDERCTGQGTYFACRPEYPDYYQFGRMLQRAVGRKYLFCLHVPPPVPWVIGGLTQLVATLRRRPNVVNIDKIREATVDSWACSCEAAARDLAYSPSQPIEQQLRTTANWYLENGWL